MNKLICYMIALAVMLSGCAVTQTVEQPTTTVNPMATWDPFVGGFEYESERIFLQDVDGGEKIDYNIAYRHRDESVEILEADVSQYATWKLVDQKLYFVSGSTLYVKELPDGELSHLEMDHQKYNGVLRILKLEDDMLLCGAEKWEKNTDPSCIADYVPVDTRIWVRLDFSEYYEDEMFTQEVG